MAPGQSRSHLRGKCLAAALSVVLAQALAGGGLPVQPARAAERPIVLVYGFSATAGLRDAVPAATQAIATELAKWVDAEIWGPDHAAPSSASAKFPVGDCNNVVCAQQMAAQVGAQELVTGALVQGANGVIVYVERHATASRKLLRQDKQMWTGPPGQLADYAAFLAIGLFTIQPDALPEALVHVRASGPATLSTDQGPLGDVGPEGRTFLLRPGLRKLTYRVPGDGSIEKMLLVMPGREIRIQENLEGTQSPPAVAAAAAGTPFYQTWWFWAIVAAAAGGGAGVALAGAGGSGPPTGSTVTLSPPGP